MPTPISTGAEWNFELIACYDEALGRIARDEFGLDCYANQIEVIDSRQMLDAYASTGLPVHYPHWSFGKSFVAHEHAYRSGARGLAYEIVINSDPCIAYLMEENPMPLQALVIAHACYGHNSFFKGNYLFRQWTAADAIVDYMVFARRYVMDCEERHGAEAVEEVLDACHALMEHGVNRYRHPRPLSAEAERARWREREAWEQARHDELWRTLPAAAADRADAGARGQEPQENLLYFVEKHSPRLAPWERELVRIVRKVAQYFYPQSLTKVMNEGWATFWHYTLLNRLYDHGLADDGFMIECLESHTGVIAQRGFDERGYVGCNPYALGFAMFRDIRRICEHPDDEDRHWFPDIAGADWRRVFDFAMRNFKDESFVAQFLSPKLIREFRLFAIADREDEPTLEVDCIHDEAGYRRVRRLLAAHYDRDVRVPDIQVVGFERDGDRSLALRHVRHRGRPLDDDAQRVLAHLRRLWGFTVRLETVDADGVPCDETRVAG
jgi:spore cortex formation protein SpoVR/YcgB (stage V sporulation)